MAQMYLANPIPAMEAFNNELKELGAKLVVVPVPPKCAVVPFEGLKQGDAMMYLKPFYEELRAKGIEVLDLYDAFAASKEPVYCKQDAHWNQAGIKLAAKKLAEHAKLEPGKETFEGKDEKIKIVGDLMLSLDKSAQPSEELAITKYSGKLIDESSPVLLLGDSHTLFLSSGGDMLAENAGLAECLASELKMPVDRIGVKGQRLHRRPHEPLPQGRQGCRMDQGQEGRHLVLLRPRVHRVYLRLGHRPRDEKVKENRKFCDKTTVRTVHPLCSIPPSEPRLVPGTVCFKFRASTPE